MVRVVAMAGPRSAMPPGAGHPSARYHTQSRAALRLPGDDYLNVPVERVEESDEPLHREAVEPTREQIGHLGLRRAKYVRGLRLGQIAIASDTRDLERERGLGLPFIGPRQPQVGEDVPAANRVVVLIRAHLAVPFSSRWRLA